MSFQDFRTSGSGVRQPQTTATALAATSSFDSSASGSTPLTQISEALLQYQRNVGILEKIVHSLAASSKQSSFYDEELNLQYQAQLDVIGQLEGKVRRLLNTNANSSNAASVQKLQRDFERVQSRAKALVEGVTRLQKDRAAAAAAASEQSGTAASSQQPNVHDHYQQQQLQLQQDRLNEEIMREREQEIRNINRGMHQVNEIYKDLAHIVGSQQEQIDSIETQMEDSKANAESGLEQVEKANEKYGNGQCTIS